jgi:hypothetical protein
MFYSWNLKFVVRSASLEAELAAGTGGFPLDHPRPGLPFHLRNKSVHRGQWSKPEMIASGLLPYY